MFLSNLYILKKSFFILILSICFLYGCEKKEDISLPLDTIINTGEIIMITYNNANCYYQYQDRFMGFEYDLAKAFANYIGVKLSVKVAEKWEDMITLIQDNPGAFMAANLTCTPDREKKVLFSDNYMEVQQYIIVHQDNKSIRTADDLSGQIVHIRTGSSYQKSLENLKKQGIEMEIRLYDDMATEEFIQKVAKKEIDVTIADSNIALLNRRYSPQIVIAGSVSSTKSLAWAVHKKGEKLLKRINAFFQTIKKNGQFSKIYNRYYGTIEIFDYANLDKYHKRLDTHLPLYFPLIKKAADEHSFDWRLIAAIIYQESHFNTKAKSSSGAYGLMQITRSTARSLNLKNLFDPKQNIEAGVRHLKILYDLYDKAKGEDRLYTALAAYNIGQGHVLDARNLAESMGLDRNKWSSLLKTLPLLMHSKYYKNSLHGYCRGTEPIEYVHNILVYYDVLRHKDIQYQ